VTEFIDHGERQSSVPGSALHVVAKICSAGGCPTIYRTASGSLLVQGYVVTGESPVGLPDGEALVEIPPELLAAAIRSMGEDRG
jgi:hypothetical protein